MNLLDALPSIVSLTASSGSQPVTITFNPPLTPEVRAQIATQSLDRPFTLTASTVTGNQLTFTAPTGVTFTATVNPPLPLGTQLQLSAADILPPAGQPIPPNLPLQAKILPPATTIPTPQPTPATPQQHVLPQPTLLLQLPTEAATTPALKNLITTTLLQQTVPATSSAPQPAASPVPPGPVAVTLPVKLPPTFIGQPLTLTPTKPMQPAGTQSATLSLANPTPATPGQAPVGITLNLGVPLPAGTAQTAILLPAPAPGAAPLLILTTPASITPSASPPGLEFQLPAPSVTPSIPQPANPPLPLAARVLPAVPGQPAGTQTVLLATGATAVLKSHQPLPTGSIIVADFPLTPTAGIQRVLNADAQSQQPQPNLAQNAQAAAPVAPQTTQAVLAPGMVIQGTITGQNEQGQPLITIASPSSMAGQSAALTISGNSPLLPVGAQLNIRVESNLNVTILGLVLPPQTQAAYTLGTIGARWEGLQQALHLLQQQAPVQAANLRASLPQLASLMPGLIAFTNALRTGRLEDAFDTEATRLLKSMGIDLSADVSQLSQLQQRPASHAETQWRGTLFPYVEAPGEDPRQGGFFWRREKSDNPRAPTSTRFVVEVEMSQLGPLQLDGLITYPEVWLKLRRRTAPDAAFVTGLQALVKSLLEDYNLTGGIAVETAATFPVNPRTELLGETENPLPTSA